MFFEKRKEESHGSFTTRGADSSLGLSNSSLLLPSNAAFLNIMNPTPIKLDLITPFPNFERWSSIPKPENQPLTLSKESAFRVSTKSTTTISKFEEEDLKDDPEFWTAFKDFREDHGSTESSYLGMFQYFANKFLQIQSNVQVYENTVKDSIKKINKTSQNGTDLAELVSQPKKKKCKCKKSKCLKMYCECFLAQELCSESCECCGCFNTIQNVDIRESAISFIKSKNPKAFDSKIAETATAAATEGVLPENKIHKRGCNCKKSNCLKKYCECFDAGVKCSVYCKCEDCKNNKSGGGCGAHDSADPPAEAGCGSVVQIPQTNVIAIKKIKEFALCGSDIEVHASL